MISFSNFVKINSGDDVEDLSPEDKEYWEHEYSESMQEELYDKYRED